MRSFAISDEDRVITTVRLADMIDRCAKYMIRGVKHLSTATCGVGLAAEALTRMDEMTDEGLTVRVQGCDGRFLGRADLERLVRRDARHPL